MTADEADLIRLSTEAPGPSPEQPEAEFPYQPKLPWEVPTHYVLQGTRVICSHCGSCNTTAKLFQYRTRPEAGNIFRWEPAAVDHRYEGWIYDRDIKVHIEEETTNGCLACFATLPRITPKIIERKAEYKHLAAANLPRSISPERDGKITVRRIPREAAKPSKKTYTLDDL